MEQVAIRDSFAFHIFFLLWSTKLSEKAWWSTDENKLRSPALEWRPQNYSGTGRDPITNCDKGNESFWGCKEEVK